MAAGLPVHMQYTHPAAADAERQENRRTAHGGPQSLIRQTVQTMGSEGVKLELIYKYVKPFISQFAAANS